MKKYDLNNELGALYVKAKIDIFDSDIKLYPDIRPNHKFSDSEKIYIGEITIDKDFISKNDNGMLVDVCFLSKFSLKEKIEKEKKWKIFSGNDVIGELELEKVIKFEVVFY